jgi:hypothetical protein
MTKEKIIELADGYFQTFHRQGVTPACKTLTEERTPASRMMDPPSSRLAWKADNLSHAMWMCGEVKRLAATDLAKANRWFGFVQGICWTMGIFSVTEMRGHNG